MAKAFLDLEHQLVLLLSTWFGSTVKPNAIYTADVDTHDVLRIYLDGV
jgi:hypothetical protein